ncbi:MAG: hypothetical protein ACE5NM_10645 [Sedimentisphaerales bacterium]
MSVIWHFPYDFMNGALVSCTVTTHIESAIGGWLGRTETMVVWH